MGAFKATGWTVLYLEKKERYGLIMLGTTMPIRALPRIGLGTYSSDETEQWDEIVRTALEAGYRHIDTAQAYGNHQAVSKGLTSSSVDREDVFLATKTVYPGLPSDPADVGAAIDTCLDQLGVDYVDLLYVHWPSGSYEPETVLEAYNKAYDAGKIRQVGLSNFTPKLLDEARELLNPPLAAHQVERHPLLQQEDLVEYAQKHDHWLVAYSPLAKGAALEIPEIRDIAANHDVPPAQVVLAWLLSTENAAAVPKASSETHLRQNLAAIDLELDQEELASINSLEQERRVVDPDHGPWNW